MAAILRLNAVSRLKATRFSQLSLAERLEIKKLGLHRPDLGYGETKEKGKRKFYSRWYREYDWLAGCPTTKTLYCFCCLLFCDKRAGVWTSEGIGEWKHAKERMKTHARSVAHLEAAAKLGNLGNLEVR